ncbi:MAG: hypothetical protein DSY80_05450 [Desulfocapsa sp.]|nr:MAG: hypothetical protein DSY80_05450 [Desulfocapsa sp.]
MALKPDYDAVIIGGGAAGLMCAITAANRGRKTLIIDHNKYIGEKIRISGGGRCNFTNRFVEAENFISNNPHFCKSALARYTEEVQNPNWTCNHRSELVKAIKTQWSGFQA